MKMQKTEDGKTEDRRGKYLTEEERFVRAIAREMKRGGIGYLLIVMRDDGKASFVLEPMEGGAK